MAGLPPQVHDLESTTKADAVPKLRGLSSMNRSKAIQVSDFVENVAAEKFRDPVPVSPARALWARQNAAELSKISEIARDL